MDIRSDVITLAGCGNMGLPMAHRLHLSRFKVLGYDIRPLSEFTEFAKNMLSDPVRIAESNILLSVVRSERQTLDLCFDDQGVFRRDKYPRTLVVSSTLSPRFIKDLATRLPQDVRLIDAPMSGAPIAAEQGALSFMLGGKKEVVDDLMPIFESLGEQIFYCGDSGAGMTLKVINNYVAAASVVTVRRAFDMARQLNVDIDQLREVMAASSGATWFGDRFDDIAWARQGYDPENTIGILEKDVLSALDAVAELSQFKSSPLDSMILEAVRSLEPYEQ